ncbi:MAG: hypothetical protein JWM16_5812 [Verrucomicrobiales bacterium]|nr:hypothetical protein [Verrucomicrobiales bacterium]
MNANEAFEMFKYQSEERQKRYQKYGGKLEYERGHKIGLIEENTAPSKHLQDRHEYLKQKFGLTLDNGGLQIEGKESKQEQTIDSFVKERQKEGRKGYQLSVGATEHNGKPVKIWFDIRK